MAVALPRSPPPGVGVVVPLPRAGGTPPRHPPLPPAVAARVDEPHLLTLDAGLLWSGTPDISRHLTTSHDISRHLTTPHDTSRHLTTPHDISRHLTTPHDISRHLTTSHDISRHLTTSHDISRHLTTSHDIARHLTTSHNISHASRTQSYATIIDYNR